MMLYFVMLFYIFFIYNNNFINVDLTPIRPWLNHWTLIQCLDWFNGLSDFKNIGIYGTYVFLQFQWIIQRRSKIN